ncbi:MAG: hypothetical protein JSV91_08085 [Phycisphaerales bacterium]|nr:MAG: hypothetical protein JSV91_08085 [Phycisphaerales bacterium]
MSPSGGLKQFRDQINQDVLDDILSWDGHACLHKLAANLRAHRRRKAFLDTFAEAMMARRLLSRGCDLEFEVPTPQGKRCDFQVRVGGQQFFLHVKRVETGRPVRKKLTVSSRLKYLERINRPYVVSIHWRDGLTDEQMQHFVTGAADFIQRASVGDELNIQSDVEGELGRVRVVAPWSGSHVTLAIGLPSGFIDEAPRIRKLMRKAYQQFMPSATNVILICTSHADDADDFETALLGSHVERWDKFPPRGRRIAHGRAADGFWSGKRFADSRAAGWFWISPERAEPSCRLWLRPGFDPDDPLPEVLRCLFDTAPDAPLR